MDDEEYSYQALQEPLYRVETGNYEYRWVVPGYLCNIISENCRLVLRCRAEARKRFAAMRSDVLVKLELLDNKHVQDIVHQVSSLPLAFKTQQIKLKYFQLRRLMANLTQFHLDCHKLFDGVKLFPIEMDLAKSAFQNPHGLSVPEYQDYLSDGEEAEETGPAQEDVAILNLEQEQDQLTSDVSLLDLREDGGGETSNQNSCVSGNLVDF